MPGIDQHQTLRAGVGKAEITCRDTGTWEQLLTGKVKRHIPPDYLKQELRVSDPLYARALVIDDGQAQVVFLTMDVTAIGARTISQDILSDSADDFVPRLRERIESDLGLPGLSVNVSASHTHQVPRMLVGDDEQIESALNAIRQAWQSMAPVRIGIGTGKEDRLTFNRTMMLKDGTDYTVRSFHATMPPDDQVQSLRPIDPEIGVLRVDLEDGQPLAVVYNFASHLLLGAPDGSQGAITADHVGVVLSDLEENIGGGVMAFAMQGALGDAVEVSQFDTGHPFSSLEFGRRLGRSVLNVWRQTPTGDARVRLATRTVRLPLRTDIPDVIAGLRQKQADLLASLRYTSLNFEAFLPLYLRYNLGGDYPSQWPFRYMHARQCGDPGLNHMDERNRSATDKYLQSIRAMERMASLEEDIATLQKHQEVIDSLGQAEVEAEFKAIQIGGSVFITAPMELLTETGLKVKDESPYERTFVVSLSNGYLHYAPPASYYPRGGYEVTECLLDPAWEGVFHQVVQDLVESLKGACVSS